MDIILFFCSMVNEFFKFNKFFKNASFAHRHQPTSYNFCFHTFEMGKYIIVERFSSTYLFIFQSYSQSICIFFMKFMRIFKFSTNQKLLSAIFYIFVCDARNFLLGKKLSYKFINHKNSFRIWNQKP